MYGRASLDFDVTAVTDGGLINHVQVYMPEVMQYCGKLYVLRLSLPLQERPGGAQAVCRDGMHRHADRFGL